MFLLKKFSKYDLTLFSIILIIFYLVNKEHFVYIPSPFNLDIFVKFKNIFRIFSKPSTQRVIQRTPAKVPSNLPTTTKKPTTTTKTTN